MLHADQPRDIHWRLIAENLIRTFDRGAAIVDLDFVILCTNSAFESAAGFKSGDLLPTSFQTAIGLAKAVPIAETFRDPAPQVVQAHENLRFHTRPLINAEGQKTGFLLVLTPANEAMGPILNQLKPFTTEQEQFAYRAAHDLQSPLSTIHSFGKLLQRRYGQQLTTEGREFLTIMLDASDKARKLVTDLLAYLVLPAPPALAPIELTHVLDEVLVHLAKQIDSSEATIRYDGLPVVWGDAEQLLTLFKHLIRNAIAFTDDVPPRLVISASSEADRWCITVKDHGIGIDSKHLSSLFDGFQRHHPREKDEGTGLGLALCRKIMALHGGTIAVDSALGEGTHFYLRFPRGRGGPEASLG